MISEPQLAFIRSISAHSLVAYCPDPGHKNFLLQHLRDAVIKLLEERDEKQRCIDYVNSIP